MITKLKKENEKTSHMNHGTELLISNMKTKLLKALKRWIIDKMMSFSLHIYPFSPYSNYSKLSVQCLSRDGASRILEFVCI